ncbi:helix-turn-helix domain-containing protein [Devosia sp. RR2S18]|uniref:helix-turn-helix domain-containing protein n=1 Tax=Devosia rhizosphaerae TaxID=3049774 RepID=UPI00254159E8|nr:helix-turn-helix transcriptional regulator [Devosia sp. RR2S18]WIJ24814.1 helix-turn-helix transcriptional regulator [Devosia sp. RR2S18]WIJ24838.1 helix-turn-helix transcriptional regulator [Devosia sp. RR2S18]
MSQITPEQSRAARGWLDWTQQQLAEAANVSLSTVRDFEKRRRSPIPNNLVAMQQALEKAGVRMIFDDAGAPLGISRNKLT